MAHSLIWQDHFEFLMLPAVQLKGKAQKLELFAPLAERKAKSRRYAKDNQGKRDGAREGSNRDLPYTVGICHGRDMTAMY